MTEAQFPAGHRGDPLLQALAEHWDEIRTLADPDQLERLAALMAGTAEPDPAEARAALADELLDLLPASHPVIRVLRTRPLFTGSAVLPPGQVLPPVTRSADASTLPVTIYLSDAEIHSAVEAAVECLLATASLRIYGREDPVIGSWFRRMVAGARAAAQSTAGQEAALMTAHAIQLRLILAQDAEVTARLLQNVAPVLGALQPTKDAVIRAGALLIVKVDWVVSVFQLTAAQQARLDLHPHFASSPSEIIAALSLVPEDMADISGPSQIPSPPPGTPPSGVAEPRNSRPAQDHHYRRARGLFEQRPTVGGLQHVKAQDVLVDVSTQGFGEVRLFKSAGEDGQPTDGSSRVLRSRAATPRGRPRTSPQTKDQRATLSARERGPLVRRPVIGHLRPGLSARSERSVRDDVFDFPNGPWVPLDLRITAVSSMPFCPRFPSLPGR